MKNTNYLQYLVNERFGKRPGLIGRIFKGLEMGPRNYSQHTLHRAFRVVNYFWVQIYHTLSIVRPVFSRFVGASNGPLNYSGLLLYFLASILVIGRVRFIRLRDNLTFNAQDNPEFWYARYNMMFPPSFLHNRISAHYIEINHIFSTEMLRKYQVARKEILDERDRQSDKERRTKYITNPNYVYEPLGPDDDKLRRLKADGVF